MMLNSKPNAEEWDATKAL